MVKDKIIMFYYKWIKGECPHFCRFCPYRYKWGFDCTEELYNDIREEVEKRKLGYYEQPVLKLILSLIKEKIRGDR